MNINVLNNIRSVTCLVLSCFILSCSPKRSQEPSGNHPYESKEVSFRSLNGDITLAATLSTPSPDIQKIAVVLIGGSGPTDRDYTNQFDHRPFLVLADYLTQQGIAVLRYDERGVGMSEGNYRAATYKQLTDDLAGGVTFLRSQNFTKIGIIAHSEGGGIAPLASLFVKTDFLILMAADNSTADQSLIYQTRSRLNSMNVDRNTSREIIETLDSLLSILRDDSNIETAKTRMKNLIAQKETESTTIHRETVRRLGDANNLIEGFLDPKFIYRLNNDPKETLRKIRIPVLMLYGDEDSSIDVNANLPIIEQALDSTSHKIVIFPGLGHLFMNAKGVPMKDLHKVEETIAPEVLSTIREWVLAR